MKKLMIFNVLILAVAVLVLPGCLSQSHAKAEIYPVEVDYNLSRKEMVEAGNYDWVDDDIFHFKFVEGDPADREGQEEVRLELIRFDEYLSTEEVLKKLGELGYRPATFGELCALGVKYSDKQKEFPIVALGSVLQNRYCIRFVMYLHGSTSGRYLSFLNYSCRPTIGYFYQGHTWTGDYRFLAVSK